MTLHYAVIIHFPPSALILTHYTIDKLLYLLSLPGLPYLPYSVLSYSSVLIELINKQMVL